MDDQPPPDKCDHLMTGMKLIERQLYTTAIEFFRPEVIVAAGADRAIAHYGLATALLRNRRLQHTRAEIQEIIQHYDQAITVAPKFSDASLMCGYAYEELAFRLFDTYKQAPHENGPGKIAEVRHAISQAAECFRKAGALNPKFAQCANADIEGCAGLERTVQTMVAYFDENRN